MKANVNARRFINEWVDVAEGSGMPVVEWVRNSKYSLGDWAKTQFEMKFGKRPARSLFEESAIRVWSKIIKWFLETYPSTERDNMIYRQIYARRQGPKTLAILNRVKSSLRDASSVYLMRQTQTNHLTCKASSKRLEK